MRLFELFEAQWNSDDLRLGMVNGYKFIFPGGASKLPPNLTASNLRAACSNLADRIHLIEKQNIGIHAFHVHLKRYNVVLYCMFNKNSNTLFINGIYGPERLVDETNLSVMEMDNLYEVFDNMDPVNYNGYRIRDDISLHGHDRIQDHELRLHVTREQIEQMMKETVDKIAYLRTLGFYVRFGQVYSASAKQALICKVRTRDNLVVIKTYLPHDSNRFKPNVVMFNVA